MTRLEARRGGRDRWAEARRAVRAAAALPPATRRYAFLLGTLFALLVALILRWGPPAFPWRLGDRPETDVDARVGYQYPDAVAQRTLERRAADATPNVYRRDDSELLALQRTIEQVLTAVKAAPGRDALPADILQRWPLTPEDFRALKSALPPEREVAQAMAGVATLIGRHLADSGLVDRERKQAEVREQRERFTVRSEGGERPTAYARDLVLVAGEREALEQFLLAQALPGAESDETSQAFKRTVARFAAARARPNLLYDESATARARQAAAAGVGLVTRVVLPGQVIAPRGQPITAEVLAELRREHGAYLENQPAAEPLRRLAAALGLAAVLAVLTGGLLWRLEERVLRSKPRLLVFGLLCVMVAATARALELSGWPIILTPVALVAIALGVAYNQRLALGSAFVLSLLAALATTGRLETFLVFLVGSGVGVIGTRQVRNRARLIEVGFAVGLSYAAAVWVMGLVSGSGPAAAVTDPLRGFVVIGSLWGLLSGVLTGFVITGGLPFIELLFKITTDISLLELSGTHQPLLRRLALEAPGTYNHSLVVGSLAEAAAEAIGANGLVARLGSLFHDIGKVTKPEYFVENRTESASRHEGLTPRMSALVIIAHVKDGVDMAREHRLPRVIRDVVAEHHGTTLVEYFYHEAHRRRAARRARPGPAAQDAAGVRRQASGIGEERAGVRHHPSGGDTGPAPGARPEVGPEPDESAYRYPGPRPRSREAAIVMLADAVESASRSMREPTPARIENLVHEIARRRIDEGQFDDSALTLMELATVQGTLAAVLARIYHSRVRYPGQEELETAGHEVRPERQTNAGS